MRIGLLLALPCLVVTADAQAEPPKDQPVIMVVGEGTASVPAEYAEFTYGIRGEGKTTTEALKALSDTRTKVETGLNALDGAQGVELKSSELHIVEARGPGCGAGSQPYNIMRPQLSAGDCAVVGYIVSLESSAKIVPADKAGNAMSLAAEDGATNVSLGQYGVRSRKALEDAAAKAAVEDAKQQAEAIAAAAGEKLGPLVSIQDSKTRAFGMGLEQIFVTAQRLAPPRKMPSVPLALGPPPITQTADLAMTYAIER